MERDAWMEVLDSGFVYEEGSASVVWGRGLVLESVENNVEVCDVCSRGLGVRLEDSVLV